MGGKSVRVHSESTKQIFSPIPIRQFIAIDPTQKNPTGHYSAGFVGKVSLPNSTMKKVHQEVRCWLSVVSIYSSPVGDSSRSAPCPLSMPRARLRSARRLIRHSLAAL